MNLLMKCFLDIGCLAPLFLALTGPHIFPAFQTTSALSVSPFPVTRHCCAHPPSGTGSHVIWCKGSGAQQLVPPTLNNSGRRTALSAKRSEIELGIRTAQYLMDGRQHDRLKKSIKDKYPLVPDSLIKSGIDIASQGFTQVAPSQLKLALKPGGMEQVRPDIEATIVDYTMKQTVVQNIPILGRDEKRKVIEAIVDLALDNLLKDVDTVLASPEVQLELLEAQIEEVKSQMGARRLVWYRLRRNPRKSIFTLALALASVVYFSHRRHPSIVTLNRLATNFVSFISDILFDAKDVIASLFQRIAGYVRN